MIQGKAITFGDNIDTDQIIGAHHLTLPTIADMAPYCFEHHPQFTGHFRRGGIIAAGENFGCGSSREQAPAVLVHLGVGAVIARSFARIFFRNAINQGLILLECPEASEISFRDHLKITASHILDCTSGARYRITPLPPFMQRLVDDGGIIAHLQRKAL